MLLEKLVIPIGFDTGGIGSAAISGIIDLVGGAVKKATSFLAQSVGEAMSSQEALSQLDAVLKSTGGAAGVTRDQALGLATSLQKVTRFSDEAVLGGENMLLTFTSIGKEVFPRATQTILDMSTALKQDLQSSAIQLGKALNDPISGITALRRVGVQFTDEQEDMIKKMVESGNLMQAQTFILDELQREFGGSAEAAGKTFGGQLEILKNKVSDIKERIGGALLPVLGDLADRFSNLIDSPRAQALIDGLVAKLGQAGDWIITNLPIWEEKFSTFMTNAQTVYNNKLKPLFDDLKEELNADIPIAIDITNQGFAGLTDFWEGHVQPVGYEIHRLIGNIRDIMDLLGIKVDGNRFKWEVLFTVITPYINMFLSLRNTLDLTRKGLDLVNDILEQAKRKWDSVTSSIWRMISALSSITLPWWLTPGSPTPLENGLRGIDSALESLNKKSIPAFSAGLGMGSAAPSPSAGFDYQRLARTLSTELAKQYG